MATKKILDIISKRNGWSQYSQIVLLCRFIDKVKLEYDFEGFLLNQEEEDHKISQLMKDREDEDLNKKEL
jgi:hypothetical protein